jgi:hypothetical protein
MTDLEKDFTKVVKKINAKIKEAAAAMKEANNLAKQAGFSSLTFNEYADSDEDLREENLEKQEEFFDLVDVYPLFGELDKAGWQTSSIGC